MYTSHQVRGPGMLDESGDEARVIDCALHAAPTRFGHVISSAPGAYLVLYEGELDFLAPLRRPAAGSNAGSIAEAGGYPLYAGSAKSLKERFRRHGKNLAPIPSLPVSDLLVVPLPTHTWDAATYAERILIRVFEPLLNQPWLAGFGSRAQGRSRERTQRVAPFNVLFPGRPGCHGPAPVTADQLRDRAITHLTSSPGYSSSPPRAQGTSRAQ